MNTPIYQSLRSKEFVSLAELQDKFIEAIYALDHNFVIHGGTAIWRCYSGNRLSYGIDAYVRSEKEMKLINHYLTWELSKRGLKIDKYRRIERTIVIKISDENAQLKVELQVFKKIPKPITKGFEKANATLINVQTLSPEDFISEKVNTYASRRYIRDLYDIYHLINYVKDKKKVAGKLKKFLKNIKPPRNNGELEKLIYRGAPPSFKEMVKYINDAVA